MQIFAPPGTRRLTPRPRDRRRTLVWFWIFLIFSGLLFAGYATGDDGLKVLVFAVLWLAAAVVKAMELMCGVHVGDGTLVVGDGMRLRRVALAEVTAFTLRAAAGSEILWIELADGRRVETPAVVACDAVAGRTDLISMSRSGLLRMIDDLEHLRRAALTRQAA
ncbi:hypothetical protein [Catellatospora tritici]|uniref:hypothetical protein n=1 Tax=Catellatospora tritici TaxID=2851566 RepID=UPI001C2D18EA|nr:hypothetical protein [Catellatospora tritici]MBV1854729.1 hypothetical protein [Catellatospora tritici]